jgi:hypothetical protein
MDKKLVLLMLDALEEMTVENLALRAILLQANRNATPTKIDVMVKEAQSQPAIRGTVRAQWLPLRQRLEDDSNLAEALNKFLQIATPTKNVN